MSLPTSIGMYTILRFTFASNFVAQTVKYPSTMQETQVWSLGQEDPLKKELTTHSSILAWRIPWTEKPGRLQSTGLQRVRHDFTFTFTFFISKLLTLHSKECNDLDLAFADLPWNKDTVLLYCAVKYMSTQALVEDACMWQSSWTNLHDWTCKRNFASLKVCHLKVCP